jgi:polysaccharide deacetylase family protein (PEP-CTERM system associated)
MINALTVDVEDYFHVEAFASVISPANWEQYPIRVERNTYRILELLERRAIHATFFILGWVAERFPILIRDIYAAGHEIGSHGYGHQMITRADTKTFRNDVSRAKFVIENETGTKVNSFRAPSYSITAKTLWALEILGEFGFEYDSSIFPIRHDCYGIPDAPRFPHYRLLRTGARLVEFPPSTVRIHATNIPVAGGGYLRFWPYRLTAWAIRRINQKENQPAMIYLHPWEIDPDQPRIAASWRSRFRHYQNLRTAEEKFSRLLDEFSWAPISDVLSCYKNGQLSKEAEHGI